MYFSLFRSMLHDDIFERSETFVYVILVNTPVSISIHIFLGLGCILLAGDIPILTSYSSYGFLR